MISTLPLPSFLPKVQIWIRGQEKSDTFFIDKKEKNKKGRREGGKKRGGKGKKERRQKKECKCVLGLKND